MRTCEALDGGCKVWCAAGRCHLGQLTTHGLHALLQLRQHSAQVCVRACVPTAADTGVSQGCR
jgi:hypothetical protein